MARKVIFLTDSHMGALNLGLRQLDAESSGHRFKSDIYFIMPDVGNLSREFMLELVDGRRILNPVLVKEFSRPWAPPGVSVPSLLNRWTDKSPLAGTDHKVFFLWGFAEMHTFAFEREWQNYGILGEYDSVSGVTAGAKGEIGRKYYLPSGMIEDRLREMVGPVLDVVMYLAERGVDVATLAGPPPDPDNDAIKLNFPAFTPAEPGTRLLIYRMLLNIFTAHAKANRYTFFEAPPQVVDSRGFRRPEYRGDGVHANAEYGRVFLESLAMTIEAHEA